MLFIEKSIPQGDGVHASLGRAATHACSHAVHFYEDDGLFLNSLSEFIGGALGAGGACVVVATESHRHALADRLTSLGIDVPFTAANNRYIALDAVATLDRFMVDDWPDEGRFFSTIEPSFLQARSGFGHDASSVVAFGEMVAILYNAGHTEAAVRLEELWNELARRHAFSLRCAYPVQYFTDGAESEPFRRICAEHSEVIPAESYTKLESEAERWRMVTHLQQRASTLQFALELRQQEIEQRKRVEEKLRRTEEFARTIIESSVDCVEVLSLDGRIEYMNPQGAEALQISDVSRVMGTHWIEFWDLPDRPRAAGALAAAAAGRVGSFQAECTAPSGVRKWWDVKLTPARGANGQIDRLIAVSRDLSELRLAQTAAIHAEKLATAGRMAASIAHEINNPLEAVTNFIYLAQTSLDVPEGVRQHLEMADRELTRVAHIARQTLGFYRSTSVNRWMAVSDLIRDALVIYERRLRNKELSVEVSVDPELMVYGKDGELRQALLNLTANAIDACQSGGSIWIRAQKNKNWINGMENGIRFTLADNGGGMTPEVQSRIFAPFFTTKADVGTGIGLWVTKCLVEQRGGYVRFRSRQGKKCGTVMSFFLPELQPAREAAAD
jgi:PAS domain S-box-containing protein